VSPDFSMSKRGKCAAAKYLPQVKDALSAIGLALQRQGWSMREIVELLVDAELDVPEKTLRRWIKATAASRPVISPAKNSGNRIKLSGDEKLVASGWVLRQEKKADLRGYIRFVKDAFDVTISKPTATRYLDEFELSRRMMGDRPRDIGVSFENYAQQAYDYVMDLRNSGFFQHDPSLVWLVDFTSTAIKKQRYHTYGARGGKQKKRSKTLHEYTDNIFTALGMDGSIIPPIAFSSNPALAPGSAEFGTVVSKSMVDSSQVVYCADAGKWVGETAHICIRGKTATFCATTATLGGLAE